MVWLFARNFSPSTFFPFTYTGMRVKTRELRRSVACVSVIAPTIVQCVRRRVNRGVAARAQRISSQKIVEIFWHWVLCGFYLEAKRHVPPPKALARQIRNPLVQEL
jgi:hypothetical protein